MTMKRLENRTGLVAGFWRPSVALGLIGLAAFSATLSRLEAQRVYSENFESLTLGPNVEEALAGSKVWTKTPPAGWSIDDTKMPGVGNSSSNGITEWAGWSFANKSWWVSTAGDQRRSEFSFGQGTVMIADPDEWDDATHARGLFESIVTTAPIPLGTVTANSLVLAYDSSWRPEARDDSGASFPVDADGAPINDQTGFITASYDGAAAVEVQRWTSVSEDATYHDHMPNESVIVALNNPAGATSLVLKIGMEKAANDWWWAVDNLAVGVPPFASGVAADGVSFTARIVQGLGKSVDQSKGVTAELDGAAVTPVTLTPEGDYLLVRYSQAPEIFAPGSRHTLKLKFTSNEGKALEDTLEFVAPSYTTVTATPTSVRATITEPEWLKVDESKGVQLQLDGAAVTGSSPARTDAQVSVSHVPAQPLAGSSQHTLSVTFTTVSGKQLTDTVSFTVPEVVTLPASLATDLGTATGAGMRWRTHQLETARGNTIAEAEAQLAGTRGASVHDTSGAGADGFFQIDFVNFEQTGGDAGNFRASSEIPGEAVQDNFIPGIPGTTGTDDNIAAEALAFVEIPAAGVYTMVVNSDDGFQVSAGTAANPRQVILGKFDAGRGAGDTAFYVKADKAGVYLFRLLWFEGTGGASVEWFTVNNDGTRALLGGAQTGSWKVFRTRANEPVAGGEVQSVRLSGGTVQITFTGTLKSSATVSGPYQPVANATSPYSVTPTGTALFFIAE